MTQQIEIFTTQDGQAQMSLLFDTSTDNVSLHLKNIFHSLELDEEATTEEFSVVREEGTRKVQRQLKLYNLDGIISVGYRISSRRARPKEIDDSAGGAFYFT